jgi:hypothetical protein
MAVGCWIFCAGLAVAGAARAEDLAAPDAVRAQWWTGTLAAPSPAFFRNGMLGVEPYLIDKRGAGAFDSHGAIHSRPEGADQARSATAIQYAFTAHFSVQIVPSFARILTDDDGHAGIADLPVRFKYRWLDGGTGLLRPSITTTLGLILPVGQFERLGKATDGFGTGSYVGMEQILLQSFFSVHDHPNRLRLWQTWNQPLNGVTLHGISSYGTGVEFMGRAVPGWSAEIGLGEEFALDRRWVMAIDLVQDFARGAHFGSAPPKSISNFMLAPALEYNLSQTLGVIAGVAFSVTGRNSSATLNPQMAVNAFF